jgi:hypothetical protein
VTGTAQIFKEQNMTDYIFVDVSITEVFFLSQMKSKENREEIHLHPSVECDWHCADFQGTKND